MENKKENDEEKKFHIKEIFTNEKYSARAKLLFFSCIIIALIISVQTSPTPTDTDNPNNNYDNATVVGLESIENRNFNFKYTVKVLGKDIVYEGKQRDEKILFKTNGKEYFKQGNIVLENTQDKYILSSNPNDYFDFFDVELIKKIISSSEKDTDNEYFASNKNFSEIVGEELLEDELYGVDIQTIKQNNIITAIIMDMSEYKNYNGLEKITLEYKNYGLIEDFEIK